MIFDGVDALLHGALAALAMLVPATLLFRAATARLAAARAMRAALIAASSFGAMVLAAGAYGLVFKRGEYLVAATMGGAVGGGALAVLTFLVLLVVLQDPAPDGLP